MKKSLTIIISALLVLTLFTACTANKPQEPITPAQTTETNVSEEIKTTLPEKTEKSEEVSTAAPQVTQPYFVEKPEPTKSEKENKPTEKVKDEATVPSTNSEFDVSKDEAKAIALKHAGLSQEDIRRSKIEIDRERKAFVYEIEFDSGKYEYDYEIDANTGKVIKAEKEIRD